MKFAHSLVLNAVPEWIDQYVDYDHLKKIVYQVERAQAQQTSTDQFTCAEEGCPEPRQQDHVSVDNITLFTAALDHQVSKVTRFFMAKEKELLDDANTVRSRFEVFCSIKNGENVLLNSQEKSHSVPSNASSDSNTSTAVCPSGKISCLGIFMQRLSNVLRKTRCKNKVSASCSWHDRCTRPDNTNEFDWLYNFRVYCTSNYIALRKLQTYVPLNKTAFEKILKKWDKLTGEDFRTTYYDSVVLSAEPFKAGRLSAIDAVVENIQYIYAVVFTLGDIQLAKEKLQQHLQNHVEFGRNTVWKDLVGQERLTMDARTVDPEQQPGLSILGVHITRCAVINALLFLVSLAVYIAFMCEDVLGQKEASRCLALLLFAVLLWAFECIPLYATAYLIPLLIVPMDIIRPESNQTMPSAAATAEAVLSSMFNGTILILLGGFSIAAALSKHGVAQAFAALVLRRAGTRPRWVVLVNMYLAAFLSMWISNVAAPVLCFSLVQPILRTLPPNSATGQCLIMGIALASCIGGLASPISSPQNIIAMQLMDPRPGWGLWFAAALPIAFISTTITWILLLLYFRPNNATSVHQVKHHWRSRPTISQIWVFMVCVGTIALWCSESTMTDIWGNNGVIALIPFLLFFGTRILTQTDLNHFLWPVVILAQGGMALGFAVDKSGLLDIIGHRIAQSVQHLQPLQILFIFGMLVLVFATFVSHTVAALIILPIVKQVGEQLPKPHPDLLIMGTAFVCSVAMGLPVSG
ncbi:low-affinity phosphate transporter [Apophysomyces sp. BC1034]|nr:low-affinity phosphate transporter [Apophysomyces sp. BC1021]KAG0191164.1 low-affinity phosphate transporter [Apophysomyces sp. BC1034]